MDVGSFPKQPDREGMPIRAYRDIFTTRFELNTILYRFIVSNSIHSHCLKEKYHVYDRNK